MKKNYTCKVCGKVFEQGWSDEEAKQELEQNFGNIDLDATAVLCDDCYNKFIKWFNDNER